MFGLKGSKVLGLGLTAKAWGIIALAALLILAAVFGAGYGYGHGDGKVDGLQENAGEVKKAQREVAQIKARAAKHEREALQALARANKRAADQEKLHVQEVADLRAEHARQDAAARAADSRTIADLRSGNQRLRLRVHQCSTTGPAPPDGSGPRVDAGADAELAPETAAALYGIAADGDAAIRDLTGLQGWARSAMKLCGTLPSPKEP